MKPIRVPATAEMVLAMAPRIRQADRDEVAAASGMDAGEALLIALMDSTRCDAWLVNDQPVAMAGVVPHPLYPTVGVIWMLATDEAERYPKHLVRGNREYVRSLLDDFHIVTNFVDNRNTKAQRWLQWLGFTLGAPQPFGVAQLPFRPFWMENTGAPAARHGIGLSSTSPDCVEATPCVIP